MADVNLSIDGTPVTVPAGTTILKAAEKLGRQIPTICYHDYCTANGLCRICVVEVDGVKPLLPACLSLWSNHQKMLPSVEFSADGACFAMISTVATASS